MSIKISRRQAGITVTIVAFLILIASTVTLSVRAGNLASENAALKKTKDASAMQATINTLNSELIALRTRLQGKQTNNISTLGPAVQHFLTLYYDNSATTLADRVDQIKPLVSADVLQSLFPADETNTSNSNVSKATFKSWVGNFNTYTAPTDDTTANVFVCCSLFVQQNGAKSAITAQLLFQATMTYTSGKWIISEIQQNRTIN